MGKRSSILDLPPTLQREIERRLVANGFQQYRQISDELARRGHKVSKTALHSYGSKIMRQVINLRHQRLEREGGESLKPQPAPRPRPTNLTTIGARLRYERKQLGLGQLEMAARVGFTLDAYKKYELNYFMPRAEPLAALARAGLDIKWLLTGVTGATER